MPNITRRTLIAQETRRKLVETSIRLFSERGFNNVKIDDICFECGVAKGTFYHHFKTKYDIISEDNKEFCKHIEDVFFEDEDMDAAVNIVLLINAFIEMVERRGIEIKKAQTLYKLREAEQKDHKYDESYLLLTGMIKKILNNSIASGQLRKSTPVDDLAETLLIYNCGLHTYWAFSNNRFSISEKSWSTTLNLVNGLLAEFRTSGNKFQIHP